MATINSWGSDDPAEVAKGGTGAATITGVLTGNGTGAVTAAAVTEHGVLVGGASNAVASTAVGTAAQVLTSNGAGVAPTFQAAGGGGGVFVFLATGTASSSASVEFTSAVITTTYDQYMVAFRGVRPASDEVAFELQFSNDDGVSWETTTYYWSHMGVKSDGTSITARGANTSEIWLGDEAALSQGNGAEEKIVGRIYLYDLEPSADYGRVDWRVLITLADARTMVSSGCGARNVAETINGIRFTFSSGNIAEGEFILYGITES